MTNNPSAEEEAKACSWAATRLLLRLRGCPRGPFRFQKEAGHSSAPWGLVGVCGVGGVTSQVQRLG